MIFKSFSKDIRYKDFCEAVQYCNLCSRMCDRVKVISKFNGNINSKVMFIAEAPGRLGADKTAIPLYGDKTGDNFEALISNIGWNRDNIFITNAVLCNPRSENGNNSTPTKAEIENCSFFLEMTINLVQPDVIITLGAVALQALSNINTHSLVLKNDVASVHDWNGIKIYPLYHPGPRAALHRSLAKQRADFIKLSKIVDPLLGMKNKKQIREVGNQNVIDSQKAIQAIEYIICFCKEISFFKLTKMLYLVDWYFVNKLGCSFTNLIYIRQEEGPWCPDLNKIVKKLDNQGIYTKFRNKKPYVYTDLKKPEFSLSEIESKIFEDVITKCIELDDGMIKTKVYLTPPMKYILKEEKKGRDMRKIPVLYKNKTSYEIDDNI